MINSGLIVSIDCGEDNAKKHEHAHKFLAVAQAMKVMHTLIGDQVAQLCYIVQVGRQHGHIQREIEGTRLGTAEHGTELFVGARVVYIKHSY